MDYDRYWDGVYDLYRKYALNNDPHSLRVEGVNQGALKIPMDLKGILNRYPITRVPSQELVRIVVGFLDVEAMIPDYSTIIAGCVRDDAGRSYFNMRWTGEEAVHGWLLSEWLIAAGIWDSRQSRQHLQECLALEWNPIPFSPRHGELLYGPTAYVVIQEKRTSIGYEGLEAMARLEEQDALAAICRRLKMEEARHYGFYLQVAKLSQECFPDEFPEAFRAAHAEFAMPGKYILEGSLPDYDGWTKVAQTHGVVPDPIGMIRLRLQLRRNGVVNDAATAQQARCWMRNRAADEEIFRALGLLNSVFYFTRERPHMRDGDYLFYGHIRRFESPLGATELAREFFALPPRIRELTLALRYLSLQVCNCAFAPTASFSSRSFNTTRKCFKGRFLCTRFF